MMAKMMSRALSAILSAALIFTTVPTMALAEPVKTNRSAPEENYLKLWYDEPASEGVNILSAGAYNPSAEDNNWQQHTLPIGNSFMGANVYGEIARERLTFNQKTLWNGGPSESRPNYNGGNLDKVAQWQECVNAFMAGDDTRGSQLAGGLVGEGEAAGYGVYQSWGDIYLENKNLADVTTEDTTGYERNLDLTTGIANVDFRAKETDYHREFFVSYPDNVLAMKLTANGAKQLELNVSFPIDNGEVGEMQGNITSIESNKNNKLAKENETYNVTAGTNQGTIVSAANMQDNQMKMNSVLTVVTDKGTVTKGGDEASLDIAGADEVVIFISANTDYKNDYPKYRTGETAAQLAKKVKDTVDNAVNKGYEKIKSRYLADYQELFNRVELNLGQAKSDKTTDQLLAAYKVSGAEGATDSERRLLEVLLYQYGRYLTIASSREGDLPSTLQGVWQNRVGTSSRVPWGSDFHMNVNLQMNYWPTYSANLAECGIPIIDYVNSLREPGRVTAEKYFGIKSEPGEANGFSAHTQNTPFGWTCPGWAFNWGWSPAAVPWIIQNCWEYFEYTGDVEYMRTHLYPMMKEETLLYDQILVDSGQEITLEDGTKSTRLVSAPAFSSEHGPRTLGNVYENVLVWQLYEDTITAAELLGTDSDLVERWKETRERLAPIEVGDSGQIKEWYFEGEYGKTTEGTSIQGFESGHRHMSHMLGLFPGDLVSVENEEYIKAAVYTLERRGYNSTGWGMGQRLNAWARTGDGNTAYLLVQNLFKGGIYPNLWDAHAPFQIDGNFGYTSGVNEMMMQSNVGYINILPAIPDEWDTGSVNGIVARGNFELGIDWDEGKATEIRVLSKNGNKCVIQHIGIYKATVTDSKGTRVQFSKEQKANRISFDTKEGETYTITGLGENAMLEAPNNCEAVKGDNGMVLTWNAVAGADSYNVYRKEGSVTEKLNATNLTSATYTDTEEYEDVYEVKYYVVAVKDGIEGYRSDLFHLQMPIEIIDNNDSRITYNGSWGDWSADVHYGGGIKYLQTSVGTEYVELTFKGTGIEFISTKNTENQRWSKWPVYIDGEEVGEANCIGASSASQQVVYSNYDLSKGTHTIRISMEGQTNKKIEVDAFVVYAEKDPAITVTYDLGGVEETPPAPVTAKFRESITLSTCDIQGFAGWSDGSTTYQAGSSYTVPNKNVTLTAVINTANTQDEYIYPTPKTEWTATAGSEENTGNDGPASSAIDGNVNTWWHSNYNVVANKPVISDNGERNEFTIDFGKSVNVDKFEYVPRNNDSANGFITKYQILTSDSANGNFTAVKTGTWENNVNVKSVVFDSTLNNVRRIQIKALETKNAPNGVAQGNQFIHAAEFNVYMKNPDYDPDTVPSGIKVTSDAVTLERGEIRDLKAAITPDKATNKNMTFTSSDLTVATVSPKGIVAASKYKSGEATITITSAAVPSVTKTVQITVSEPEEVAVESISLEKQRIVLREEDSTSVTASITPYYGTDKTVTWSSSDNTKVLVTNGTITAVAAGHATITATTKNSKTAACEVYVLGDNEVIDRTGLVGTVQELKAKYKDLSKYDTADVTAFNNALKAAETVLGYGTSVLQEELDEALENLDLAIKPLLWKDLEDKVAEDITTQEFADSTVAAYNEAHQAAQAVLDKGDSAATEEIDAALFNLSQAIAGLAEPGDCTALEAKIAEAEGLNTEGSSETALAAFTQALAAAKDVAAAKSTQKEIDGALGKLKGAIAGLSDNSPAPDKTALKRKIDAAKEKDLSGYTAESAEEFRNAIEAAEAVYNKAGATEAEINSAINALEDAEKGLVEEGGSATADKTALKDKIDAAKEKNLEGYTEESKQAFTAAIEAAEAVYNKENATEKEISDAIKELEDAEKGLVEEGGSTSDKDGLRQKLEEAEGIELSDYTTESADNLENAINAAWEVYEDDNATEAEIKKAIKDLEDAIDALEEKGGSTAPDKGALKSKIDAAKEKKLDGFTEESKQAFLEAIEAAEKVYENANATNDDIEKAIEDLAAAEAALVEEGGGTSVDRTALKRAIDTAKAKPLTAYTPASVTVYKNEITKAEAVYNNANATQAQINAAVQALNAAARKLVFKANTAALTNAVNAAVKIDVSGYTTESVTAFKQALAAAQTLLKNQNVTQAQVTAALTKLQQAQKNLKAAVPSTIEADGIVYNVTNSSAVNGTVSVSGLTSAGKKKTTITIPPTVEENGYTFKVTAIDKNAFAKSKKLKKVIIGENVTNIGANCFTKCSKLATIQFKSPKAPKIGKKAFKSIKSKVKVFYSKKMKKKELNKLKKAVKSAGVKKVTYKKK